MTRKLLHRSALAAGAVLALGVSACGGGDDAAPRADGMAPAPAESKPAAGSVDIKTFMFKPDPVRVKAGTTVTWNNQDDILHTVTSGRRGKPTPEFDKKLNLDDEFTHTFDKAGTYPYVCTIHNGMDGTVIVS